MLDDDICMTMTMTMMTMHQTVLVPRRQPSSALMMTMTMHHCHANIIIQHFRTPNWSCSTSRLLISLFSATVSRQRKPKTPSGWETLGGVSMQEGSLSDNGDPPSPLANIVHVGCTVWCLKKSLTVNCSGGQSGAYNTKYMIQTCTTCFCVPFSSLISEHFLFLIFDNSFRCL